MTLTETPTNAAATTTPGATLTIEGKWFGKGNQSLFPNFQMPLPAAWNHATVSLQELLEAVVRAQVAGFNERQQNRTVLQALSATQIAEGLQKGKVGAGLLGDVPQTADPDEAVATALQAFADGTYFVFVSDDQKTSLTDIFSLRPDTRITFLRLVALAGG